MPHLASTTDRPETRKLVTSSSLNVKYKPKRVFDLGGTNIRSGMELAGEINEIQNSSSKSIQNQDDLADSFAGIIITDIQGGLDQRIFVLSVAGPVSEDLRTIEQLTNVLPDDKFIPLADMIEKKVKTATGEKIVFFLMNDGHAGTIAEMTRGVLKDVDLGIAIIAGTGVGGGACKKDDRGVIMPVPFHREFGHWSVDLTSTIKCNCGRSGCLETQASGPAAERIAREIAAKNPTFYETSLIGRRNILPESISGKDISTAAKQGDKYALTILDQITKPMAAVINNIFTSTPDMHVAIVGGLGIGFGDLYIKYLRNHIVTTGMAFNKNDQAAIPKLLEKLIKRGTLPADETNMIGTREFLRQQEEIAILS